jgi:hypothetical protein
VETHTVGVEQPHLDFDAQRVSYVATGVPYDQRDRRRLGDLGEVAKEALVIERRRDRRDRHDGVGTGPLGVAGVGNGQVRALGTATDNRQGPVVACDTNDDFGELASLRVAQTQDLRDHPRRQPGHTLIEYPAQFVGERGLVDAIDVVEGGLDHREDPGQRT